MKSLLLSAARTMHRSKSQNAQKRRGVMFVFIGILLFLFLASVALSVDVAYMHLVNAELRAATDAAAKAAVTILVVKDDQDAAIQAGIDAAAANIVAGQPLPLEESDIVLGGFVTQAGGKMTFSPGAVPLCAARVTGHRDQASSAGAVALFFGRIFNVFEYEPVITATAVRLERDIALALDRSGSMWLPTTDGRKKSEALVASVEIFLEIIDDSPYEEQLGLVSYSSDIKKDCDLGPDTGPIQSAVDGYIFEGQTNIGDAVSEANGVLTGANARSFAQKTIVLLTDGNHNTGTDPLTAAAASQAAGITIHTITFGTDADQATMKSVADLTNGIHYHADDGDELEEVFEEIARSLTTILIE